MNSLSEQVIANGYAEPKTDITGYVHFAPVLERDAREALIKDMQKRYGIISELGGSEKARVHIGAAGLFNLDIIATGHHDAGLFIDVNEHQKEFWDGMIKMIADSPTAKDLKENIKTRLADYFPDHLEDRNGNSLNAVSLAKFLQNSTWHKKADDYAHIHGLAKDGKLGAVLLDVFDVDACKQLASAVEASKLDGRDTIIDTVYGSNIWHMASPQIIGANFDTYAQMLFDQVAYATEQAQTMGLGEQDIKDSVNAKANGEGTLNDDFAKEFGNHCYDIIQSVRADGHTDIAEGSLIAADRIYAMLMSNYHDADMDALGITNRGKGHFYPDGEKKPTLEGLQSLCGNNHSGVIYLCKTYPDRDPLTKLSPNISRSGSGDLPPH